MMEQKAWQAAEKGEAIVIRVDPSHIDLLNKLMEGYDHLALVSTLDAKAGKLVVWVTKDTYRDALRVLKYMPFPVKRLSRESKGDLS